MYNKFENSIELLMSAEEQQLYQNLIVQLTKDFGLANIVVSIDNETLPSDLVSILREKIYVLILEKFNDYLNLLYVIDVPEKAFRQIDGTDVVEVAEEVTFVILKREYQKVILKQKYSS